MSVFLSEYPEIIRLADYCDVMAQSPTSIRRELRTGRCRVVPCMVRPYRWRRADVAAYLSGVTVTADRRFHAASRRGM